MDVGPEAAFEPILVEQGEEELEVLFDARVWGGGHEEEVAGDAAQEFSQLEAARLLQLAEEVVRRHPVRLIDHHQVPFGVGELRLQLLVAGQLVHTGDHQRVSVEHVHVDVRVHHRVGQDLEVQPELEEQLVLPLLHQTTRSHDETPLHIVAEQQLLDVQPRHDRLARARIVGQQEPQRRAGEEFPVDGRDLVRQGLHVAGRDRQHRVEQPSQADALRLGSQLEVGRRRVERAPSGAGDLQPRFVGAVEDALVDVAHGGTEGEFYRVLAMPLCGDDRHRVAGDDPIQPLAEEYPRVPTCPPC